MPSYSLTNNQGKWIPPPSVESILKTQSITVHDWSKKPPMTEIEKTRKKKIKQSFPKLRHNRPLPFQESVTTFKVGPGSYSHSLDLIGKER